MAYPSELRGPTMFQHATVTNNGTMYSIVNDARDKLDHLHLLYSEVATNAILNAGGRADVVRCHPGTRENVISRTEHWMKVGYREDRRIFWLSGPAGAGKSAIVQTIAEDCLKRKMVMANFFFFRSDGSRNNSGPVVATLLHQLIEQLPDLARPIDKIILKNHLIFKKPLHDQFRLLLDTPIRSLWKGLKRQPPIIFLIDGLDECDSGAHLDFKTTSEQTSLLEAFHDLVTPPDSPFIALVASRIESHIQMTFNQLGRAAKSINLNADDEADGDIRRYITAKLTNIRLTHPLGRYLGVSWPSNSDIESIVEKASGQFIYASVVVRFLASSPQSPAMTMEMVQHIRPANRRSPFSEIDAMYSFILSRSDNWDRASEIVALCKLATSVGVRMSFLCLLYPGDDVPSYFCDLTPIIKAKITTGMMKVTFYHASFNDFIHSRERAGKYLIDLTEFANYFAPEVILRVLDFDTFRLAVRVLNKVTQRSDRLTYALTHITFNVRDIIGLPGSNVSSVQDGCLASVEKLYGDHDPEMYGEIFACMKQQGWIPPDVSLTETQYEMVKKPLTSKQPVSMDSRRLHNNQRQAATQQLPLHVANSNGTLPTSTRPQTHYRSTWAIVHRYFAPHSITWDVRDSPAAITLSGRSIPSRALLEPACVPPRSLLDIILTSNGARLPWSIRLHASRSTGFVKLEDVFMAVDTILSRSITLDDWALLESAEDRAAAASAYQDRYRRLSDDDAYHTEKMAGMKRVDFLMGCHQWVALEKGEGQGADFVLRLE